MVIIKAVKVDQFRGMRDVAIPLDGDVVAISGQNGTQKTTLLGMLSQPFSLSNKSGALYGAKTVDGGSFGSKLRDKFKFSEKYDVIGSHVWTLKLNEEVCGVDEFSCTSIARSKKKGYDIRFWSTDKSRKKGTGYVQLPVLFLSLKRLMPIGEMKSVKTCSGDSVFQGSAEVDFYKKYHNEILLSSENIEEVSLIEGTGKSSLGPVTGLSDAITISAGQDNVGKIILTILSFRRLKEKFGSKYQGGLVFVDELETALYPAAQIQILKFMFKMASELSLQFFITTHSETIIKFLKRSQYAPKARITFLKKLDNRIFASTEMTLPQIENNLVLRSFPEQERLPEKLRVYAEDDKAFSFITAMLPKSISSLVTMQRKISLGAGNYKELIVKKVPEFLNSVVVLDGDKNGSKDGIRTSEKSKFPQVVFLPSLFCPEKLLYRFARSLAENDGFWNNESGSYTRQICLTDYQTEPSTTVQYKNWFYRQHEYARDAQIRLIRYWAKKNPTEVNLFKSSFVVAYNWVAAKSGYAKIEEQCL